MPEMQGTKSRATGEIHIVVLSATVAISVEIFTFLFGLVWSLGRMMFNLSDAAATLEAGVVGLATLVLAVAMARMFYRNECQNLQQHPERSGTPTG